MPDSLWPERRGQKATRPQDGRGVVAVHSGGGDPRFRPGGEADKNRPKNHRKHNKHVVIGLKIQ